MLAVRYGGYAPRFPRGTRSPSCAGSGDRPFNHESPATLWAIYLALRGLHYWVSVLLHNAHYLVVDPRSILRHLAFGVVAQDDRRIRVKATRNDDSGTLRAAD